MIDSSIAMCSTDFFFFFSVIAYLLVDDSPNQKVQMIDGFYEVYSHQKVLGHLATVCLEANMASSSVF